jgi:hypothetical protein
VSRPETAYQPGQAVDLAIDRDRPDWIVLVDGGGESISFDGSAASFAGTIVAVIAISLLLRFLIGVF